LKLLVPGGFIEINQEFIFSLTKNKMNPVDQFQHALKLTSLTIDAVSKIGDMKRSFYVIITNDMSNDLKLTSIKNLIFRIRSKPYDEFELCEKNNDMTKSDPQESIKSTPNEESTKSTEFSKTNILNEKTNVLNDCMIDIIKQSMMTVSEKYKEIETLITNITDVLKNDNLTDEIKINRIENILL
jgi:hypothetical protein